MTNTSPPSPSAPSPHERVEAQIAMELVAAVSDELGTGPIFASDVSAKDRLVSAIRDLQRRAALAAPPPSAIEVDLAIACAIGDQNCPQEAIDAIQAARAAVKELYVSVQNAEVPKVRADEVPQLEHLSQRGLPAEAQAQVALAAPPEGWQDELIRAIKHERDFAQDHIRSEDYKLGVNRAFTVVLKVLEQLPLAASGSGETEK